MRNYIVYLVKATNGKKYIADIHDSSDKHLKKVSFGAAGYEDYTTHKDKERMNRYNARHKAKENWTASGIKTAGFWSKWLLWNKPSLSASIKDIQTRFGVTIKQQIKH